MTAPSIREVDIEDLEGRIEEALMSYEPVRSSQLPLRLEADASASVRLEGWVRSRVIKDTIEDIVRHVPGVAQVTLALVVDPELEVKVARALAKSSETAGLEPGSVILRANLGAVRVIGSVGSQGLRDNVLQVVRDVEGVRRVEDDLQIA